MNLLLVPIVGWFTNLEVIVLVATSTIPITTTTTTIIQIPSSPRWCVA
jgi:hypothetical protein